MLPAALTPRLDTEGRAIQAHGGGVLRHEGRYYWYGEDKGAPNVPGKDRVDVLGVRCYSSDDALAWKDEGRVLAASDDPGHDLHSSRVAERPKVLFNAKTGRFVMRLHVDAADYTYARQGVAVSDSPTGPFTYLHSERPAGKESRDFTVWQEGDAAWTVFSTDWNANLAVARLSDDYLATEGEASLHLLGQYREAPALFRHAGRLWMLSSGCTGWEPNPARLDHAPGVEGPWTPGENPCEGPEAELTFRAQSTFVLTTSSGLYALFDRWQRWDLQSSDYLWLRLDLEADPPRVRYSG